MIRGLSIKDGGLIAHLVDSDRTRSTTGLSGPCMPPPLPINWLSSHSYYYCDLELMFPSWFDRVDWHLVRKITCAGGRIVGNLRLKRRATTSVPRQKFALQKLDLTFRRTFLRHCEDG